MPMVACPICASRYEASEEQMGMTFQCSVCQNTFVAQPYVAPQEAEPGQDADQATQGSQALDTPAPNWPQYFPQGNAPYGYSAAPVPYPKEATIAWLKSSSDNVFNNPIYRNLISLKFLILFGLLLIILLFLDLFITFVNPVVIYRRFSALNNTLMIIYAIIWSISIFDFIKNIFKNIQNNKI
jgi:hypothetical protein